MIVLVALVWMAIGASIGLAQVYLRPRDDQQMATVLVATGAGFAGGLAHFLFSASPTAALGAGGAFFSGAVAVAAMILRSFRESHIHHPD